MVASANESLEGDVITVFHVPFCLLPFLLDTPTFPSFNPLCIFYLMTL
jgi:hypothetical protein